MSDDPDQKTARALKAQKIEGLLMGFSLAAILAIGGALVVIEMRKSAVDIAADAPDITPPAWVAFRRDGEFASGLSKIWGVAIDADGTVLACGQGGLKRFDRSGRELAVLIPEGTVRAVAPRRAGGLYAVAGDQLLVLAADGSQTAAWRPWAEGASLSAVLETGDHVFVAEIDPRAKTGQVHRLSPSGELQISFGHRDVARKEALNIPGPYLDLGWHRDQLYVTNPGRHRVHLYDVDGNLLQYAGIPSWKGIGFSGCCNPASVAVLPDGTFVTAEKGLPRVKKMSESEGLLGYVAPKEDFLKHGFGIDLTSESDGGVWIADSGKQLVLHYLPKQGWSVPSGRPSDEEDHDGE